MSHSGSHQKPKGYFLRELPKIAKKSTKIIRNHMRLSYLVWLLKDLGHQNMNLLSTWLFLKTIDSIVYSFQVFNIVNVCVRVQVPNIEAF